MHSLCDAEICILKMATVNGVLRKYKNLCGTNLNDITIKIGDSNDRLEQETENFTNHESIS